MKGSRQFPGIELVVFKRRRKTLHLLTKNLNGKPMSKFVASSISRVCSGEGDIQCLQILPQMLDLAAADGGEDKWCLEKVICNRNYGPSHERSILQ